MKIPLFFAALAFFSLSFSQSNTEVHLFDLSKSNNKINITNHKNISNNDGYDSQPSFLNEEKQK